MHANLEINVSLLTPLNTVLPIRPDILQMKWVITLCVFQCSQASHRCESLKNFHKFWDLTSAPDPSWTARLSGCAREVDNTWRYSPVTGSQIYTILRDLFRDLKKDLFLTPRAQASPERLWTTTKKNKKKPTDLTSCRLIIDWPNSRGMILMGEYTLGVHNKLTDSMLGLV